MVFRTRTVVLMVIVAMFLGSIITQLVDSFHVLDFANEQHTNGSSRADNQKKTSSSVWEASGLSEQQLNKIASTYYLINQKYYKDVDGDKLVDGAIQGMLSSLEDPYTVYMNEEQAKHFAETVIEASFSGIGAEVTMEDGKVTVIAPIKNSPAEKAGILARDKILSVNGEKLEGLSLTESVAKIRGPKGTQARLEVLREGLKEPIEIIVIRDEIDLETVSAEMLDHGIGKIEIIRFSQNTVRDFMEELARLEEQQMRGLIIDVRNNPGGMLTSVVDLAEPFIPNGKVIVQTEDRKGNVHSEISQGSGKPYPIVVLINEGSASASEILAAALQESAGSTLIGTPTYGKGTVQTTFETFNKDGSNIKMTISKWLTPNGNDIHEVGVQPDIVVEQPEFFKAAPLPRNKVLKYDMVGSDVENLQIILSGLGIEPDRTDGYFSEQTALAVKAFQRMHGMPVTGEVDEQTASKLEEELVKQMRKPEHDQQLAKAIEHLRQLMKK